MYFGPPPEVLEAETFSVLPAALRGMRGGNFLEGPAFDRAGHLLCVDIRASRIYRISPAGDWHVLAAYEGMPNGLKLHRDGRIFVADRMRGLLVVDPTSGKVETVLAGPAPGERFRGLNDLHFAANGDLYFTDQGRSGLQDPTGRVYCLTAAGRLDCVLATAPSPNGLALNQRETALYVAVTRANAIWRIELDDPERRTGLFVQLPSAGPDGVALDAEGNLVVAQPTGGMVWLFGKRGEPCAVIRSAAGEMTTNVAYGGGDLQTLFIVESRSCSILSVRMRTPGKPLFSHA